MPEAAWGQVTQDFETSPRVAEWERLQLVVVQEGSSQVVELRAGLFTVGRAADADLVIDDPSISRMYTRLFIAEGRVVLSDLGTPRCAASTGWSSGWRPAISPC